MVSSWCWCNSRVSRHLKKELPILISSFCWCKTNRNFIQIYECICVADDSYHKWHSMIMSIFFIQNEFCNGVVLLTWWLYVITKCLLHNLQASLAIIFAMTLRIVRSSKKRNLSQRMNSTKEPVIFGVQFNSLFVRLAAQDNRGISINLHKIWADQAGTNLIGKWHCRLILCAYYLYG